MKLKPNFDLGQHFLVSKQIIRELIASAHVEKSDNVVEIGAGTGNITKELARQASKVLALEIDERFKPQLSKLPKNVAVKYVNAFDLFGALKCPSKRKRFDTERLGKLEIDGVQYNKIIASMPYALCESLAHQLLFAYNYDVAAWIVPDSFITYLLENPIPRAMLRTKLGRRIAKNAFKPQPKTESRIVVIRPRKTFDLPEKADLYLMRCLYLLEAKKFKNALREAMIKLYEVLGRTLTKRQACDAIDKMNFSEQVLETRVHDINSKYYFIAAELVKQNL